MADELVITKSDKLKAIEDGSFLSQYLLQFGHLFLDEWEKESQSTDYWRKGAFTQTRNFGKVSIAKPLPNKLTERTGVLIESQKQQSQMGINNVKLSGTTLTVTKGSRVVYAARQEYQLGGARSYVRRSLAKLLSTRMEIIKKRAMKKTIGAFK